MAILLVNSGEDTGLVYPLNQRVSSMGRSPSNTVHIDDKKLSRYHAEIMRRGDKYYVRDLESTNGTYVNGVRLTEECCLAHEDLLKIGNMEMVFEIDGNRDNGEDSSGSLILKEETWGRTTGQISAGPAKNASEPYLLGDEKDQVSSQVFATLSNISEALSTILDLDVLLEKLIDIIFEIFRPDRGFIIVRREEDGELQPLVMRHSSDGSDMTISRSIIDQALADRVAMLVADARDDERFNASESIVAHRIRTAICAPMISKNEELGVIYIDTQSRLMSYNKSDLVMLNSIAAQAAAAISNAQLHARIVEQKKVEQELEIAHSIQKRLLPKQMPEVEGFQIAATCIPAKQVGGDYFDFIPLDNQLLGIAIADVSGKGVPAAILSSSVRAAVQVEARYLHHSPAELIDCINRMAYRDTSSSMFLSMVFGLLNVQQRQLQYINAGHNYPILFDPDGKRHDLTCGCTLLGISEDLKIQSDTIDIPPGSTLVIYTDGVIDIQNQSGESLGLERLTSEIESRLELPAADIIRDIKNHAFHFKGSADPYDDFTLIVIKSL